LLVHKVILEQLKIHEDPVSTKKLGDDIPSKLLEQIKHGPSLKIIVIKIIIIFLLSTKNVTRAVCTAIAWRNKREVKTHVKREKGK
jgi:hypothetical protein